MIVSLPSGGGTKKTNANLFFHSCGGLSFLACFLFWREGGTVSWAEPGWEAGQGGKKLPAGAVESGEKVRRALIRGMLAFWPPFLLGGICFFS